MRRSEEKIRRKEGKKKEKSYFVRASLSGESQMKKPSRDSSNPVCNKWIVCY